MNEQVWPAAMALFDELSTLDAAARATRMQQIGAASPELAACVARLLQADAGTGPLDDDLAQRAPSLFHELAQGQEAIECPDLSGQQVDAFTLLHRLGSGGMGEVYSAERRFEGGRQRVALKLLGAGLHGPQWLHRFQRERRILAQLNHPHIAGFIDAGVDSGGRPWLAMELIEGVPLTRFAAALPQRERVHLLTRVGDAVAYAHGRLIVHRDLKPANILVDAHGEPRVLDFGIAKLLDAPSEETTLIGARAISPAYAAPEQILGEPASVSMDVYALGVLLYELITGELPHRRHARSIEGLVHDLDQEITQPPSLRVRQAGSVDARQRHQAVDADLDLIVLHALRREPDRRYASVADLVEDLRRWLARQPIRARPDTWSYRVNRFMQRHRGGVLAGMASVIAVLIGLGLAIWQAGVAREQARRAEAEALHATRIRDFLTESLHSARAQLSAAGAELKFSDWALATVDRIDRDLADAPLERAEIRTTLARVLDDVGQSQRSAPLHEQAIAELRALDAPAEVLGEALHGYAMLLNELGDLDRSEALLEETMRLIDQRERSAGVAMPAAERDTLKLQRISVRTTQLRNANDRGDYAQALAIGRSNLDDRRALLGDDAPALAVDYNNLGANLSMHGLGVEAEQALRTAERLLRAQDTVPPSRFAYIENGIGMALLAQGRLEESLQHLATARDIGMRTMGERHRFVAETLANEANVMVLLGRLAEADAALEQARMVMHHHALPPDHRARMVEAKLRLAQRDPAAAITAVDAARESAAAAGAGDVYRDQLDALHASALALSGRSDEAVARCDAALRNLRENPRTLLPKRAESSVVCARVYRLAMQEERAATAIRDAESLWTPHMGGIAARALIERMLAP